MKLTLRCKGGPGSGAHGHKGIPGHQGGGLPVGESAKVEVQPVKTGKFSSPEELVAAFKKGKSSATDWSTLKVYLDGAHPSLSQEVLTADIGNKKYALIATNYTEYVNVKNSRLRDTSKTRYNVSLSLEELKHSPYNPENWIRGESFTISGASARGEGRITDEKMELQKSKIMDLVKMNTGNDRIHWYYY